MPRVMFRNASVRAAQNMKIICKQLGKDSYEARVAGQDVVATAPTEGEAVRDLKKQVLEQAKSNDGLGGDTGFRQNFV